MLPIIQEQAFWSRNPRMKIQCDVCEKAEATLLCCADEAALCSHCDNKVHAANKLASKHQRIPLIKPSLHMPKCDICQEKAGYFFCLEDRALLCRQCDVSIHSVNTLVAAHQRFLVTGIKVGLEPANPISSPVKSSAPLSETPRPKAQASKCSWREASPAACQGAQKGEAGGGGVTRRGNVSEYLTEFVPGRWIDEFLNISELDDIYGLCEPGSSKADDVSAGETEWITSSFSMDDTNVEDCLAKVPEMPPPPTASGLYWPRSVGHYPGKLREDLGFLEFDDNLVVPDIGCQSSPPDSPFSKRRRLFA